MTTRERTGKKSEYDADVIEISLLDVGVEGMEAWQARLVAERPQVLREETLLKRKSCDHDRSLAP